MLETDGSGTYSLSWHINLKREDREERERTQILASFYLPTNLLILLAIEKWMDRSNEKISRISKRYKSPEEHKQTRFPESEAIYLSLLKYGFLFSSIIFYLTKPTTFTYTRTKSPPDLQGYVICTFQRFNQTKSEQD